MKRTLVLLLTITMIVALVSCVTAQGNLDVWTNYNYTDESERTQGNGYNIDVSIDNQWGDPIEINQINVQMDWQSPGEFHSDMNVIWLEEGNSYQTSIFIDIPMDAFVGDHSYQVTIEFDVHEGNNTIPETWSQDEYDFFVESQSSLDGTGDSDGGEGGLFGGGGISFDWGSIDNPISVGSIAILFVVLLIGVFVVIPVVYFLSRK